MNKISIDGLDLLKWSKATPEVRRKETTARVHQRYKSFIDCVRWWRWPSIWIQNVQKKESSINLVLCCIKANVKFNWKHKSSSTNIDLEINRVETSKALLWRIVDIQFLENRRNVKINQFLIFGFGFLLYIHIDFIKRNFSF